MTVVGPRIKRLREGMQLSLRDLSARSGVSAPMLSQVERGETSPTLATAGRIASGLELTLSQLLRLDEAPAAAVVRATDRPVSGSGPHRVSLLTPDMPGQRVTVAEHDLAPGSEIPGADARHEPGSREVCVVLEGEVRLEVDGQTYDLARGDSVTFDSDLEHRLSNPGSQPARFLSVLTAGLRRA
ncbi:MAG TPA: XRE family transcriptional regulator [Gaiellales bacterium]|jgi:transcriptional regulator with XRE-family HTH domain